MKDQSNLKWSRWTLRILLCTMILPGGWVLHESQAFVVLRPTRARTFRFSPDDQRIGTTRESSSALHSVTFPPRRTVKNTSSDGSEHISARPNPTGLMKFLLQPFEPLYQIVTLPISTVGSKAFGWYMHQLTVRPVPVKSLTAGMIGMVGDAIAQSLSTQRPYHLRRGLALMADGVLSGPFMHITYDWLERLVPTEQSESAWYSHAAAIIHVLADCLILDSLFVAMTILLTGVLEGIPGGVLLTQFQTDYFVTLKASWITSAVLFPIQFCMFRFLPLRLRVLGVNFLDVIWDAVLSFNAHRSRVFV